MLEATTARKIMDTWAKKPLDFEPGTKWQYSNTNYVIAGAIVERVAGLPFFQFLQQNIFKPLGMTSVLDIDQGTLSPSDPTGYMRYALGPLRVGPKEGKGWLMAAGELAMTAADLAKWDIAIMEGKLLQPASYLELGREVLLKNGLGTNYGLGVSVNSQAGRRSLSHGGEVSGFTATNTVFPDDRAAVVVLVNQDAAGASGPIAAGIPPLLFATNDPATAAKLEQAKKIFEGLQQGKIDRSLFTENANGYFSEQALEDFKNSLGPLGKWESFTHVGQSLRGGMVGRTYIVRLANRTIRAWTFELPDGKLEQFQVAAGN
jgi:CubicO group peptidase (beta-lactamase class C family)